MSRGGATPKVALVGWVRLAGLSAKWWVHHPTHERGVDQVTPAKRPKSLS